MKRYAVSSLILLTVRGLGLAVFPEVAMFRLPVLDFLLCAAGLGVIVFVSEVFDLGGTRQSNVRVVNQRRGKNDFRLVGAR